MFYSQSVTDIKKINTSEELASSLREMISDWSEQKKLDDAICWTVNSTADCKKWAGAIKALCNVAVDVARMETGSVSLQDFGQLLSAVAFLNSIGRVSKTNVSDGCGHRTNTFKAYVPVTYIEHNSNVYSTDTTYSILKFLENTQTAYRHDYMSYDRKQCKAITVTAPDLSLGMRRSLIHALKCVNVKHSYN